MSVGVYSGKKGNILFITQLRFLFGFSFVLLIFFIISNTQGGRGFREKKRECQTGRFSSSSSRDQILSLPLLSDWCTALKAAKDRQRVKYHFR